MTALATQQLIDVTYIIAVVGFILALKWLSSPVTAMRGDWSSQPQRWSLALGPEQKCPMPQPNDPSLCGSRRLRIVT